MLKKMPPDDFGSDSSRSREIARWVTIFFVAVLFPFVLVAFGIKLVEFFNAFKGDSEGAFAITPMVNYLLASLGFLCLLLWSMLNGTFSDMELPKQIMLEREEQLDGGWQKDGDPHYGV